jgi:hypothetical protein
VGVEVYKLSFFVFLDAFNWRLWLAIILTCGTRGFGAWLIARLTPKVQQMYGC